GSHVTRVLLDAGCDVAIAVRPGNPLRRLQDVAELLTIVSCDLNNPSSLRPMLAEWQPEACLALPWYAEPGKYLTATENVSSLSASLGLLDELIRAGCTQIVMTGT